MSNREKLIRYKLNVKSYLRELHELSMERPLESHLLPLEATEHIRNESKEILRGKPTRKIHMDFDERKTERFKKYVVNLHRVNPNPVYIWTDRTNSCGLYEVSSLLKFKFDFPFDVNTEGIIVLLSRDLNDTLTLDFSHDEKKFKCELELDVCGKHWASIEY